MKTNTLQKSLGLSLIILIIILGILGVFGDDITAFPRLLIGMAIGYVLSRGSFGFAGMANRTFRTGNAGLIKGMMITVVITSIIVAAILFAELRTGISIVSLSVFPITWGLFLGGLLFGIGMAFSSCCATGVLQDLVTDPLRAGVTLLFFATGVLIGFPIKNTAIGSSAIIGSDEGISLLDIFPNDGTNGIFSAFIITLVLAALVYYGAILYENKNKSKFQDMNLNQEIKYDTTYEKVFVKPYTMMTTTLSLSILIGLIFLVRGKGWSASSVIGYWLASLLNLFGVDAQTLADYAQKDVVISVFQDPSSLQNIGIILGTIIALLLAGTYVSKFKANKGKKPLELVLFAIGGILMGFGTRLSLGCNVGAFLTPTVGFSLSGWIYFIVLISSGFLGNIIYKWFYALIKK